MVKFKIGSFKIESFTMPSFSYRGTATQCAECYVLCFAGHAPCIVFDVFLDFLGVESHGLAQIDVRFRQRFA